LAPAVVIYAATSAAMSRSPMSMQVRFSAAFAEKRT